MPTRKPHAGRKRRRPGAYAEVVTPALSAAAYSWPCPRCACRRNLRGLLREVCANCTHVHYPPAKETP